MVVKTKDVLMATAGVALAFGFSSCKKDKESETDKLVGEWETISVDGMAAEEDERVIVTFERNLDFSYCYTYDDTEYCYDGVWEWGNEDETEVDVTITDGTNSISLELEIDELTSDRLEGDLKNGAEVSAIVMEKRN